MENDDTLDKITHLISTMEEGKLDRMLNMLHNASDDSDKIDEKN